MNISPQYVAGFLDGEGCIQMVRQRSQGHYSWSHRLLVAVSNTYEPIVRALHARYGGVFGSREVKNGRKKVYYWHLSGQRVKNVLDEVMPYLIEKKPQAVMALDYLVKKTSTQRSGRGRSIHLSKKELALRDSFYWALRNAKK